MNASTLVQKLWNYCNVLRDDGMSYGDYVEQLTYLLFLKMADERSKPPYSQKSLIPADYAWPTLLAKSGDDLFDHYRHALEELGKQKGTLGLIFGKAQNKFQDPAKLTRVIADLIDTENWSALNVDVKGDAYEGLLEKNAQDTKSGAGQYFTPRALIQAMVSCIAPKPGETICDPACGTGVDTEGRLLGARVVKHAETPGLGDKIEIAKAKWILDFNGKSLIDPPPEKWGVKKDGGVFDQFAGATITPRAVVKAVKSGLEFFAAHREEILK